MDLFDASQLARTERDAPLAARMRPRNIDEFLGQEHILGKGRLLRRAIEADQLSSLIFYGPPGTGKTTLAAVIANTTSSHFISINAVLAGVADIRSAVEDAQERHKFHSQRTILFIDEVHRLSRVVEEVLYSAMEEFFLSWVMGKGLGARSVTLRVPPFTLVGATTRYAMVSAPLRNRFGSVYRLDFYDQVAIQTLLARSAGILKVEVRQEGLEEIARRARGTPRVANRLLKRVRDYAQVMGDGVVTGNVALEALSKLEIDAAGLDEVDHKVLSTIVQKFDGGPVGLETIAASISEEPDTIMDVYEPYLLQLGLLERTPRGRVATRLSYEHLGLPYKGKPDAAQRAFWSAEGGTSSQ